MPTDEAITPEGPRPLLQAITSEAPVRELVRRL